MLECIDLLNKIITFQVVDASNQSGEMLQFKTMKQNIFANTFNLSPKEIHFL